MIKVNGQMYGLGLGFLIGSVVTNNQNLCVAGASVLLINLVTSLVLMYQETKEN